MIEEIEEMMQESPDPEDDESPSQSDLSMLSQDLHALKRSGSNTSYEDRECTNGATLQEDSENIPPSLLLYFLTLYLTFIQITQRSVRGRTAPRTCTHAVTFLRNVWQMQTGSSYVVPTCYIINSIYLVWTQFLMPGWCRLSTCSQFASSL